MTFVASRGWGSPLSGPLDTAPHGVSAVEARVMLDRALDGLPLGTFDRQIVAWLAGWDQPTIADAASLFARARHIRLPASPMPWRYSFAWMGARFFRSANEAEVRYKKVFFSVFVSSW